ncbi:MAG: DUF1801 domain-containing protein [Bacteroidales bacterium]|jgi:uncharacterized protein YdhG (YjbR/CyaY superfamily)|nr:DUF1801 domain-containing protein [Bacteroidales bacterium]
MKEAEIKTVDEYLAAFSDEIRVLLEQIRATVRQTAPEATESITFQMPTYKLKGKPLVYFAGYKRHIGFYPIPSGIEAFKEELADYKQSGKGTVQFPHTKPLPLDLIRRIVEFRVWEVSGNQGKSSELSP